MLALAYAFLGGLSGAAFSLGYKFREQRGYPISPFIFLFYLSATLLSLIFIRVFKEPLFHWDALWLGMLFGAFTFSAVRLYFTVTIRAQLNISWLVIQLCIVIPFLISILIYGEQLTFIAGVGVALVFVAIVLFGLGKGRHGAWFSDSKTLFLLLLSSLCSGLAMSVPRVYAARNPSGGAFTLVLYAYCTASLLSLLVLLFTPKRGKSGWVPMVPLALYMGLTGLFSMALIAPALQRMGGAVIYPIRSVVNILGVFLLSFLLFREKVKILEGVGAAIALAGVVLITWQSG